MYIYMNINAGKITYHIKCKIINNIRQTTAINKIRQQRQRQQQRAQPAARRASWAIIKR